ncbi:hypothetical protein QT716_14755 [Sporosarcina aquimarina]|uniref:Uncharacterized protein n=2 Tax=Sporosarcina aquimarina TaxID=114975 RepID=A0ABU4G2T6_9BACL|nr:hypothetical protein [Sporosarcina aquimarina]
MDELRKRLRKELQESFDTQVLTEKEWTYTTHKILIRYTTVTKTKMDVLMKMLLHSLQQLNVQKPEELADILGVELLFVKDLLDQMKVAGLVVAQEHWSVTEKGRSQLEAGMLIHEAEEADDFLLYSPIHQRFLNEDSVYSSSEEIKPFRYEESLKSIDSKDLSDEIIKQQLSSRIEENNTVENQQIIERILAVEEIEKLQAFNIEFLLYNRKDDNFFVRIWNSAINQWDDTLEQLVTENERPAWREKYASKTEGNHDT